MPFHVLPREFSLKELPEHICDALNIVCITLLNSQMGIHRGVRLGSANTTFHYLFLPVRGKSFHCFSNSVINKNELVASSNLRAKVPRLDISVNDTLVLMGFSDGSNTLLGKVVDEVRARFHSASQGLTAKLGDENIHLLLAIARVGDVHKDIVHLCKSLCVLKLSDHHILTVQKGKLTLSELELNLYTHRLLGLLIKTLVHATVRTFSEELRDGVVSREMRVGGNNIDQLLTNLVIGIVNADVFLRLGLGSLGLGSLGLRLLDLGSLDLGSLELGSLELGSLDLGSLGLGSLGLGSLDLGSLGLGLICIEDARKLRPELIRVDLVHDLVDVDQVGVGRADTDHEAREESDDVIEDNGVHVCEYDTEVDDFHPLVPRKSQFSKSHT